MIIRKARQSDVDQIYGLYKEFEETQVGLLPDKFKFIRNKKKPVAEYCKKGLLVDIRRRKALFLVAEKDDKIVGYIVGGIYKPQHKILNYPLTGSLEKIAVKKEFRGQGISSMMWNALYKWFKKKRCKILQLQLILPNSAQNIYEHWGFEPIRLIMKRRV